MKDFVSKRATLFWVLFNHRLWYLKPSLLAYCLVITAQYNFITKNRGEIKEFRPWNTALGFKKSMRAAVDQYLILDLLKISKRTHNEIFLITSIHDQIYIFVVDSKKFFVSLIRFVPEFKLLLTIKSLSYLLLLQFLHSIQIIIEQKSFIFIFTVGVPTKNTEYTLPQVRGGHSHAFESKERLYLNFNFIQIV